MLHNDPKWPPPGLFNPDAGPTEPSAVLREFARMCHEAYEAFVGAGFTAQQAVQFTLEVIRQAQR